MLNTKYWNIILPCTNVIIKKYNLPSKPGTQLVLLMSKTDLECIHCGSNPSSVAWSCLSSKSIQHTSPSHLLMLITGLLMGSLQLSVVFSVGDSLGGSSSYCTILSHTGGRALSYFRSFRSGIGNWWQVSNTEDTVTSLPDYAPCN